jgi:hypothetical protein
MGINFEWIIEPIFTSLKLEHGFIRAYQKWWQHAVTKFYLYNGKELKYDNPIGDIEKQPNKPGFFNISFSKQGYVPYVEYNIIDSTGKLILKNDVNHIGLFDKCGMLTYQDEPHGRYGLYGLIDNNFNILIPPKYYSIWDYDPIDELTIATKVVKANPSKPKELDYLNYYLLNKKGEEIKFLGSFVAHYQAVHNSVPLKYRPPYWWQNRQGRIPEYISVPKYTKK